MSMPTTSSHKVPKSTAPTPGKVASKHSAASKRVGMHGGSACKCDTPMDAEDYTEVTHGMKPSAAEERREAKVGK